MLNTYLIPLCAGSSGFASSFASAVMQYSIGNHDRGNFFCALAVVWALVFTYGVFLRRRMKK